MGNSLKKLQELQKSFYKKANDLERELRSTYGDKGYIRSLMKDLESLFEELLEVFGKFLKEIHNDKNYTDEFREDLIQKMFAIESLYENLKRRVGAIVSMVGARGIDIEEITIGDILSGIGSFVLKAGVAYGLIYGALSIVVPALGFTASGITKGSVAASYQSAVLGGTIPGGSVFSVLQSVGAAGVSARTQANLMAGCLAGSAVHSIAKIK